MKLITIILFLAISFLSFGQTNDQIAQIQQTYSKSVAPDHSHQHNYVKDYSNEIEFLASNLFLLYKKYVSSQDASSCSFTPSCSVYAVQAVKSQGLIIGLINFFDRFSRCNSLSPEDYQRHNKTNRLFDPLRNHAYQKVIYEND